MPDKLKNRIMNLVNGGVSVFSDWSWKTSSLPKTKIKEMLYGISFYYIITDGAVRREKYKMFLKSIKTSPSARKTKWEFFSVRII